MTNTVNTPATLAVEEIMSRAWCVNPENPAQVSSQKAMSIISRFTPHAVPALKDETVMIFEPYDELFYLMHATRTKEGVTVYDPTWWTGVRLINHKLYTYTVDDAGKVKKEPDVYALSAEDVAKKAKKMTKIGRRGKVARQNLEIVLGGMPDAIERNTLAMYIARHASDMDMLFTKEEWRHVIEVTQEMIDAGLTEIINPWMESSGWAPTAVHVGDALVVDKSGLYTIRRAEFLESHSTFVSSVDM